MTASVNDTDEKSQSNRKLKNTLTYGPFFLKSIFDSTPRLFYFSAVGDTKLGFLFL
jgi:hypothetical protein